MQIQIGGPNEGQNAGKDLRLDVSQVTRNRATFGADGKATSNRFFVSYSLVLRKADNEIFSSNSEDTPSLLISVKDRYLAAKIPLGNLGIDGRKPARIDLKEANSLARILPYKVSPFTEK